MNSYFPELFSCCYCLLQLNEIITNPTEGHFWQVDHIKPVYSGGGQCSLENLQTLCTICHREVSTVQSEIIVLLCGNVMCIGALCLCAGIHQPTATLG